MLEVFHKGWHVITDKDLRAVRNCTFMATTHNSFLQQHYNRAMNRGINHDAYIIWNDISDEIGKELKANYTPLDCKRCNGTGVYTVSHHHGTHVTHTQADCDHSCYTQSEACDHE